MTARLAEMQRVRFQAYSYAARVQTLLRTALHTIDHLQNLLDAVGDLVGNLQGSQVNTQAQMVIGKHMTNLDVQTAAFQRAQTVDKLSEALVIESINRIQAKRMEDWPQ